LKGQKIQIHKDSDIPDLNEPGSDLQEDQQYSAGYLQMTEPSFVFAKLVKNIRSGGRLLNYLRNAGCISMASPSGRHHIIPAYLWSGKIL